MQRFFNPYPKHLQIRELLLRRLRSQFEVGDRFPSEKVLCEEFEVSRETVREALAWLAREGYISRHRGRGSFVARCPAAAPGTRLTGLSEDLTALDPELHIRILAQEPVPAAGDVADAIGVSAGDMVYRLTRLRLYRDEPFSRHESYLPLDVGHRLDGYDLTHRSLVHVLEHGLGIPFWEDCQEIEAQVADTDMARLLGVPVGAPLLYLTRLWLTEGHRPLVLFRSHYRSDRYYYTVRIDQRRNGALSPHRPVEHPRRPV